MGKILGRRISLGIAKEAVRGTAETAATFYLPLLSKSYDEKIEQVVDESSIAVIEDSVDAKIVKKFAGGDFECNIGDKSFGLLLLSLLGTVTSVVKETTAYNHTYAFAQTAQHQALTMFLDDPNVQDYKYPLGMVESLEINLETGKFATFKIGVRSKKGATATLTPSYTAENNFLAQHAVFKIATNLAGLTAASAISIKKITLKFSPKLEDDVVLGSVEPADFNNTEFSVDGSVELTYDDATFITALTGDTAKAMRLDMINTDVTIGATSNPELKIDLAKVKFQEVARKMDNKSIITQTLKFKAFYSMTDSQLLSIVLTNLQTAY
ncbi:MAG: phage tail tube protein [Patescibacteria group bacterium]